MGSVPMGLEMPDSEIKPNTSISAAPSDAFLAPLAPSVNWIALDPAAHSVQFYEDDDVLMEGLSRFIGSALGAGDAAVVIATKPHRDGLARVLRARGLDVGHAEDEGRYVSLDADETMSKILAGGSPDAARLTAVLGDVFARAATTASSDSPRVAVFAEMVALMWARGMREAAIRLEQMWNDLSRAHSASVLCAYPIGSFSQVDDAESLERVCAEHSQVIPAESYTSLTSDEERLRAITLMQQRAQALETEMDEHRRVLQTLQIREAELGRAVAARSEFLAVAAHELKTPITSLRAFAQLLLRDAHRDREIAPERLEAALRVIELQTGKLTNLVRRLLDNAQIEAGRLQVEPVTTDLVALVHSALAPHQDPDGYTVVFDGPEHLEATVDPVRFEQVVTYLLENAAKFSPEGGVVTVRLVRERDGGIELSVTDQGVGVPPDQRERLFERSCEAHIQDHRSGLGLGLYITREIVEAHGGSVRVEAPEQGGSRFVVTFPPPAGSARIRPAA